MVREQKLSGRSGWCIGAGLDSACCRLANRSVYVAVKSYSSVLSSQWLSFAAIVAKSNIDGVTEATVVRFSF